MTFAEYRLIIVEEDDSQLVELVGSGTKGLGVVQGVEVEEKQGDQGVESLMVTLSIRDCRLFSCATPGIQERGILLR